MARILGSNGERTAAAIRQAAMQLIYDNGYQGFGLRALALAVGLQPASLYNHFASKQDLLFGLIGDHMAALIGTMEAELAQSGPAPRDRLACFAAVHMDYHIERKHDVYIANFELRALTPENRAAVIRLRRRYELLLIRILDAGVDDGSLTVADTHVAAYAMIAMMTGACTWYKPSGRLGKAAMIRLHTGLLLDGCATLVAEPARAKTPRIRRERNAPDANQPGL